MLKTKDDKILHLNVPGSCYPVSVCGDSCAVNLEVPQNLEEKYGIQSPPMRHILPQQQ